MTENEENKATTETESEGNKTTIETEREEKQNVNSISNADNSFGSVGGNDSPNEVLADGKQNSLSDDSNNNSNRTDGSNNVLADTENGNLAPTEGKGISDGDAAHMEGNVALSVSDGDAHYLPYSVSDGNAYGTYYGTLSCSCGDVAASPFSDTDVTHIGESLDALLYAAHGILFFIIFAWAEKKISTAVKRLFRSEKIN